MKRICKKAEPDEFVVWKESFSEVVPGWDDFDGKPIKQAVKQSLLLEQGYICCFCENEVSTDKGHIAHLNDRRNHSDEALHYGNMLYSCPENSRTIPQTCGQRQGSNRLPISPLDNDCEERFTYIANGKIFPKNEGDTDADRTITILNLNAKHLVASRAAVIREIIEERKRDFTDSGFQLWADELLELHDGRFEVFWTAKKYAITIAANASAR
jgi:uncharacterized protein (TIGR02646 family)